MSEQSDGRLQEVEWQFDTDRLDTVEHWLAYHSANLGYAVVDSPAQEQQDTYYDTEDWRLHRAGYALRVRLKGEGAEATLKSLAEAVDGVRSREELTEQLENQSIEALSRAAGLLGECVRAVSGSRALRPYFEIRTNRHAYILREADRDAGEVVLDEVTVPRAAGEEPIRFNRVEVELREARDSTADAFVQALREGNRLRHASVSKFEAGLAARGLEPASDPDLGPTAIHDGLSAGEMAFAVLRRQFGAFLSHEAGSRLGEDPEEVHDMRVAARRLRAAMKLFENVLPEDAQRLREEVGWAASALGAVRDLDVQLQQGATWIEEAPPADRGALEALMNVLRQRRATAHRAMLQALDSPRYDRLVSDLTSMLQEGPQADEVPAARMPVLAVAPDLIERSYEKTRKLGERITGESAPEEYHELRIRAKRLRYALEFFEPLYRKPVRELVPSLVAMQDVLGRHQDAEVAMAHLRQLTTGAPRKLTPEAAFVVGGIARRYEEQAVAERAAFPEVYRDLKGNKGWKKLRQEMEKRRPPVEAEPAKIEPLHAEVVDLGAPEAQVQ
ncbi:MAG: CHAD domain-containing protein [Chloroflexota bacterium]|nr:CHAD domain-containing protein [Chloroflexota bacterium]